MYLDVETQVKSPDRKCLRRNLSNRNSDSRNMHTKPKTTNPIGYHHSKSSSKPNRFEKIPYSPQKLIGYRNTVIILITRPDNHEVINTLVNEFLIHD